MLATLIIGLREGLEAALIVGIVAAFLSRNGRGLGAMWLGVALAIGVSVVVGVALWVPESALPQAPQEALETVIGAVAVVFVTGMLLWMHRHARSMKRELESSAGIAAGSSGSRARSSSSSPLASCSPRSGRRTRPGGSSPGSSRRSTCGGSRRPDRSRARCSPGCSASRPIRV